MTSRGAADQEGPGAEAARWHVRVVWLIVLTLLSALVWAYFARLDEVATAEGQVVPVQQEQAVESLEGGIVRELRARADQIVEAGEILARLDPAETGARVDEVEAQLQALKARVARFSAEVTDGALQFPSDLEGKRDLMRSEKALYDARRHSLSSSLALIRDSRELLKSLKPSRGWQMQAHHQGWM
jgi:membrane fusion protein, adhesin transport system